MVETLFQIFEAALFFRRRGDTTSGREVNYRLRWLLIIRDNDEYGRMTFLQNTDMFFFFAQLFLFCQRDTLVRPSIFLILYI
ncbi:hypothetical protein QBD22_000107 [Cronobacter muytjensii]|uniref:hypothetical protein n=1 Tax=Cronobacter muytjensii TaxID=413501 RepID=UPI00158805F2|nr:hypothetical protein [Cronobacter muytjensii]EKS1843262.1 hypothetical protein [Cronobacter muytjensii]NUW58846.1 hypothetical protein [Cronobacter muytjensii]